MWARSEPSSEIHPLAVAKDTIPSNSLSHPDSRDVPSSRAASEARRRTAAVGTSTYPSGPTVPTPWTLSAAARAPRAPSAGPSPGCRGTACTENRSMSSRSRSMTPPVERSTTSSIGTPAPDSIRHFPGPYLVRFAGRHPPGGTGGSGRRGSRDPVGLQALGHPGDAVGLGHLVGPTGQDGLHLVEGGHV